uniref:Uncharacterized protein n=1 Tax=Rhizophora mucronata TaxID=61149 RepID=A0A2P2PCB8_RHIMU
MKIHLKSIRMIYSIIEKYRATKRKGEK